MDKPYKLCYLPIFQKDLEETIRYISVNLNNPKAAERLLEDTEKAILERLESPLAFAPFPSVKTRKHPYYQIRIRNFSIFYVVIGDMMEVRRFIYSRRDFESLL